MGMTRKKNKNPPLFSHEFVIQNHADILACFAIVIVMGLMSDKTASMSRLFVFLQYGLKNESSTDTDESTSYSIFERGIFDVFTVTFAAVMLAVIHAVLQDYGIEKMSRKLHLSKTKNSKFNESGQLTAWSTVSTLWGIYEIYQIGFIGNIASLWKGYPHTSLEWSTKLFYIFQIGYWLHMYPELYFQRVKKEELSSRLRYYTLHFIFIAGAYALHFWKVGIVLLTLHCASEAVFHSSRMHHYAEKEKLAKYGFLIWQWLFPLVRFITLTFSLLTFFFGLDSVDNQGLNFLSGCYNSLFIRLVCIGGMSFLQSWLIWNFVHLRLRKVREEEEIKKKLELVEAADVKARTAKSQKKLEGDDAAVGSTREKGKLKKN